MIHLNHFSVTEDNCTTQAIGHHIFWTTQPDACGSEEACGAECGNPGLRMQFPDGCGTCTCCGNSGNLQDCPRTMCEQQRTIANNDWVRGLVINMLFTDARRSDSPCGVPPGALNGHWSESFMSEYKSPVGTHLRYIATGTSVKELVQLVKAYVVETMQKLIKYGVAVSIDVEASYKGRGVIAVAIIVYGRSGVTARVAVQGRALNNSWVWV